MKSYIIITQETLPYGATDYIICLGEESVMEHLKNLKEDDSIEVKHVFPIGKDQLPDIIEISEEAKK